METGKLWVVCGFTGTGKTTLVKNMIRKIPDPIIYDVNNEYGKPQYYRDALPPINEWLNYVNSNVRKKIVIIDEATIFFNMQNSAKSLTEMLVRKRHTQNTYILNFHFLSSVPNHILAFTNYFVLFKTKERPDLVESKYKNEPMIWQAYNDLNANPDKHAYRFMKRI